MVPLHGSLPGALPVRNTYNCRLVLVAAATLLLLPQSASARVRIVGDGHATETRTAEYHSARLVAEFERQEGVLLGWEPADAGVQRAILDIVRAAWARVPVLMLVTNAREERRVRRALRNTGLPEHAVRFIHLQADTIWARDFGPMVLTEGNGKFHFLDAGYGDAERTGDDAVPARLGQLLGVQSVDAPLYLDGGNLLHNGAGLVLTTSATLDRNDDGTFGDEQLRGILEQYYAARDLVILEPLQGEPTGHVDMFATFVARDTVVVGAYSPDDDPVNARILDWNASRLEGLPTPNGPLKVVRIPMPPHDAEVWPSYTNVLFANGRLLLPVYPRLDPTGGVRAAAVFRRLLPGWRIAPIDCSTLIELGGAIHCVTMNLPRLPDLGRPGKGPVHGIGGRRIAARGPQPRSAGWKPASTGAEPPSSADDWRHDGNRAAGPRLRGRRNPETAGQEERDSTSPLPMFSSDRAGFYWSEPRNRRRAPTASSDVTSPSGQPARAREPSLGQWRGASQPHSPAIARPREPAIDRQPAFGQSQADEPLLPFRGDDR